MTCPHNHLESLELEHVIYYYSKHNGKYHLVNKHIADEEIYELMCEDCGAVLDHDVLSSNLDHSIKRR